MKTIKNLFFIFVGIAFLWGAWSTVKPFWNKYWLKKDMEHAAVYGTKRSIEETRQFLDKRMTEGDRGFQGDDFEIDKDEKNDVYIAIRYQDSICVFGALLKELEFEIEVTATDVEQYF
jgi:hypothetical protein